MKLSRRKFIANVNLGLIPFVFGFNFTKLWASSSQDKVLPKWWDLVDIAKWCPSVHNLQPHQIKIVSETEAHLYYNPERLLKVGDPKSIFATVAMGIFIEHLSIAANPFGYKVVIDQVHEPINTKAKQSTLFITLKLVQTQQKETLDTALIKKRRTSRTPYQGKALKQQTVDALKEQADRMGQEFFHSSDQELIDLIIDLNQKTLFEDLESKPNREELDNLFRYKKKDAEIHKDGLWSKCMGFPGVLLKSVFQNHKKWTKGLHKKVLRNKYNASFDGTCDICWIGGKFDTMEDWLDAGKFFARNWLLLTKEGAYLQPTGSLITNETAYKKINETLTSPGNGKTIWMAYRAGYSKEPARSYRLDTETIIIK